MQASDGVWRRPLQVTLCDLTLIISDVMCSGACPVFKVHAVLSLRMLAARPVGFCFTISSTQVHRQLDYCAAFSLPLWGGARMLRQALNMYLCAEGPQHNLPWHDCIPGLLPWLSNQ